MQQHLEEKERIFIKPSKKFKSGSQLSDCDYKNGMCNNGRSASLILCVLSEGDLFSA